MNIFKNIFKKKYLGWDEYQDKIKALDKYNFKKSIEAQNSRVEDEDMNLSS